MEPNSPAPPMLPYADEPGAIPLWVENIAPDLGRRQIGNIPYGLSAVCGENEEGKTRLMEAICAIPIEVQDPAAILTMTRGADVAAVGFGARELRITQTAAGDRIKRRAARTGGGQEGPIHPLPDPIEMMITGGDHVSADANWRARLKAMLGWVQVEVNEDRLSHLAGVLPAPDADLSDEIKYRHSGTPFPSLLEAADWLADGRSGELHRRKRTAKEEAARHHDEFGRLGGGIDEIVARAARESGMAGDDPELIRILRAPLEEAAEVQREHALLVATRGALKFRAGDRERAAINATSLRESQGNRPDPTEARERLAAASTEADAAAQRHANRLEAVARVRQKIEAHQAIRGHHAERIQAAATVWADLSRGLAGALETAAGDWPDETVATRIGNLRAALAEVEAAVLGCEASRQEAKTLAFDLGVAERTAEQTEGESAKAALERQHAEEALGGISDALESWDRVRAEADKPLPALLMPGEFEILDLGEAEIVSRNAAPASADATFLAWVDGLIAERAPRAIASTAAKSYQDARADQEAVEKLRLEAQERAARLEADALAVWDRLGAIISGAIASDFVRVAGERRIEVRLDDGRWVDVADSVELSRGRLRRAFLAFYLERAPVGDRNVLISDEVMLPIGEDGRRAISRQAAAKQIRLFFEQPRLGSEAAELHVVFYGGAA